VAVDYSAATAEGRARVASALTPALDACSARLGWDDARRRWAGDYAGQRAELEARAASLPAPASAGRLDAIFAALPEADRAGLAERAAISDAAFQGIGQRLRAQFDAAGIPRGAQAPAAGYVLALAHLREIEAAWASLPRR
jgi:hypothetical protein